MAQWLERWTPDLGSGHDVTAGLRADRTEPVWDSLSPSLCPSPACARSRSLSLSLSLSEKNKHLKDKVYNLESLDVWIKIMNTVIIPESFLVLLCSPFCLLLTPFLGNSFSTLL